MLTLTQVWGALLIFVVCPLLGAVPLTGWITRWVAGKRLAEIGTGNVGVSAAFYHGGPWAGVPAVMAEAGKGIGAVLLARHYFPTDPAWELVALMALVMGRYWGGRAAGTTNVVWGFFVHDPITAGLICLISLIGFTVVRERRQGRVLPLVLMPVLTALRHGDGVRVGAIALLAGLIAWIYTQLPDDLELPTTEARVESKRMFQFFRGDRALLALGADLPVTKAGNKGATLSQLKGWGYPVPRGYVLPAGDDPATLIAITQPSPQQPVVVRSSALGEDGTGASAAGQYTSLLNITSQEALATAITQCFSAYNRPGAVQYRRDRGVPEGTMAVIVQQQVQGVYSGVAFSRDPIARSGPGVAIEALPGGASGVVSGQQTPERYLVAVQPEDLPDDLTAPDSWHLPPVLTLTVQRQGGQGEGTVPRRLLQQVAFLARHLEQRYGGLPQDIEWTFDGEQLWLLQSRPITTLYPLWTRKIAAEVIPGLIRPLTWSINRPLTCGVWGEIFTLVLGRRAAGLDFEATATLHHSRAYFNASLLGDIFLRMGLPPESLEFLTRGAKFTKPPLSTTLRNLPGLLRLGQREWRLPQDFEGDRRQHFDPLLAQLQATPARDLDPPALLARIETLLTTLERATYYSILAPLSLALRQGITKAPDLALEASQNPEVASLRALQTLGAATRTLFSPAELATLRDASSLFTLLAESADGASILTQFEQFLQDYGYLSQVGTDIAVPTWREDPHPVRELLAQFVINPPSAPTPTDSAPKSYPGVQARLDLKGQVTATYSRLLAELRWAMVALEGHALGLGWVQQPGDLFFLTYGEVRSRFEGSPQPTQPTLLPVDWQGIIAARRHRYDQDQALDAVPYLVYGNQPPAMAQYVPTPGLKTWQGIAASPGQVEGTIRVLRQLRGIGNLAPNTILVVPYTDAGWAPLLARAGGIISEVGGRLSHGAIVAREYGIPAVMDVAEATQIFQDGQRVRLDGTQGTVDLLA